MTSPVLRRRSMSGAAVLLSVLAAALSCHSSAGHERPGQSQRLSFRQLTPGTDRTELRVTVTFGEGEDGRVERLYSLTETATGAPVAESLWERRSSGSQHRRDWGRCAVDVGEPPEEVPATVQAALDSIVGPPEPPAAAERLGPESWRLVQGRSVMTVRQTGSRQTDRIVTLGIPSSPDGGAVIDQVELGPATERPQLRPDWSDCRPSRR
ncbi:hypothetical protein ACWEQL_35460 [Kitasatospora sp. NPDC004240]